MVVGAVGGGGSGMGGGDPEESSSLWTMTMSGAMLHL